MYPISDTTFRPCPKRSVNLTRHPHEPGEACYRVWHWEFLGILSHLLRTVDGLGDIPVKLEEGLMPNEADLMARTYAAVASVKAMKTRLAELEEVA